MKYRKVYFSKVQPFTFQSCTYYILTFNHPSIRVFAITNLNCYIILPLGSCKFQQVWYLFVVVDYQNIVKTKKNRIYHATTWFDVGKSWAKLPLKMVQCSRPCCLHCIKKIKKKHKYYIHKSLFTVIKISLVIMEFK